jgi:hypothetical protein
MLRESVRISLIRAQPLSEATSADDASTDIARRCGA